MLWLVQWCMGESETSWGVLELPEPEFGIGLGAVGLHHLADRPVVVGGDQDPFTEHLCFELLLRFLK